MHVDRPLFPNNAPLWFPGRRSRARDLPAGLADWLLDPGSLTRRLRGLCGDRFRVRVLRQGWARPGRDEARVLSLRPATWAWTREVQLLCDERPWVFARSLIPARTLRGRGRRLTQLGTRPLGQVLFTDPGVHRGPVEIARIVTGQRLHQRAFAGLAEPPDAIWGRRSVFWIEESPLLVCEIFLPDLPASPAHYRPDLLSP